MQARIESFCGARCENCIQRKNGACGGCLMAEKTPYHKSCRVAACGKARRLRFCGECEKLPCKLFLKYDGRKSGDGQTRGAHVERCRALKAALVRQAREGVNPVSVCGHHCDYCFMGQWCGGCRSDYNCCSFAGLFADQKCPNVACASEKGLDGCYECGELEGCEKGYYSKPDEYVAKATALFLQKYGRDCYTSALKRAIESGADDPKSFDAAGSVAGALELLERDREPCEAGAAQEAACADQS